MCRSANLSKWKCQWQRMVGIGILRAGVSFWRGGEILGSDGGGCLLCLQCKRGRSRGLALNLSAGNTEGKDDGYWHLKGWGFFYCGFVSLN